MPDTDRSLTLARLRQLPVSGPDDEAWEVGVVMLPGMVKDKGDPLPWQPVCAVCVSNKGGAMMSPPVRESELSTSTPLDAVASFALDQHVPGARPIGYLPKRVLVSRLPEPTHAFMVEAMDRLGVRVEVKDRLPNLEGFVELMEETLETIEPIDAPPLMKAKGMTLERVRSFAEAAALFWEREPWTLFDREKVWAIAPRPRTRFLSACMVIGAGGEEFGLAFLSSAMAYYSLAFQEAIGRPPTRPPGTIWSMTYVPLTEAPAQDARLWVDENMPLADPEAFPLPIGVTEADNLRRPTPEQLNLIEALLRGFAKLDTDDAARDAIEFDVETAAGRTQLELRCSARAPV